MTIDWMLFSAAAVLLLAPSNALLPREVELLSFDRLRNRSTGRRSVLTRWLDPLRGFGGAFLLKVSLPLTSDLWNYVPHLEYGVLVGVLVLGVVSQVYTRREVDAILAPMGYLTGVLFAMVSWPVALIALIAGITGMYAFRQFHAYLGLVAVVVTPVGLLLETPIIWLIPMVCLLLIPVLASLMTGRTLEVPVPVESPS